MIPSAATQSGPHPLCDAVAPISIALLPVYPHSPLFEVTAEPDDLSEDAADEELADDAEDDDDGDASALVEEGGADASDTSHDEGGEGLDRADFEAGGALEGKAGDKGLLIVVSVCLSQCPFTASPHVHHHVKVLVTMVHIEHFSYFSNCMCRAMTLTIPCWFLAFGVHCTLVGVSEAFQ